MEGDRVVAVVNRSWFAIAVGKIEFRRPSVHDRLRESIREPAWPLVRRMLDAGVVRDVDLLCAYKARAMEWDGYHFKPNGKVKAFDYAAALLHSLHLLPWTVAALVSLELTWLALPGILWVLILRYHIAPHWLAARIVKSPLNQAKGSRRTWFKARHSPIGPKTRADHIARDIKSRQRREDV